MTGNMHNLLQDEHSFAMVERNAKAGLELAASAALNGVVDGLSSAKGMKIR